MLHAERIGHGYHSVDEPAVYSRCLEERVHFEVCPCSSLLTGAVSMSAAYAGGGHPVLRFARDGANFSINTDDPTVTGTRMEDEFKVLRSWGLSDAHLVRAVSFDNCQDFPLFLPRSIVYFLLLEFQRAQQLLPPGRREGRAQEADRQGLRHGLETFASMN